VADRLVYEDSDKTIYITTEAVGTPVDPSWVPPQYRVNWSNPRDQQLATAIDTLRQWADQAESTTVTSGNAVVTLGTVVQRLGVFFDRFADLLERQYGG
jgi:hypothetical protein